MDNRITMSKTHSKLLSKHNPKRGSNSAETSDDDHSHSGRGSSNSSAIYSDSGNSSAGQNQTARSNVSPNTSIGGIALSPGMLSTNIEITNYIFIDLYIYNFLPKTLEELALSFQCWGSSFDFFGLVRGEGRNGVGINGFSKNNRRKENLTYI